MNDKPAAEETLYVLYDAQCALCKATVARLRSLRPVRAELQCVPLQSLESDRPPAVPGGDKLDMAALRERLHVIDASGRAYAGADGVVRIMRTLPGLRHAAWLYRIPGMRPAADAVYRWVARRRFDWFGAADDSCESGACRLPGTPDARAARAAHKKEE